MSRSMVFTAAIFLLFAIITVPVVSQTLSSAKKLQSDMMDEYNKYVRPVEDQSQPVYVNVTMYIFNIHDFDEVLETLSFAGLLTLVWVDDNMKWNPYNYGGVWTFTTSYKNVWVPDLILLNPSDELGSLGKEWQQVRYYFNGVAVWTPGAIMKTTCPVNVTKFPFDTQVCKIDFFPWGFSSSQIHASAVADGVDLSFYTENGAWNLAKSSSNTSIIADGTMISYIIHLERKPLFILVNILLPIMFLGFLNVLVFILPVDSGERVSYCITVLLSIAVFLTIISDTLPKSSEPMPIIAYILMSELVLSSLITFITIINLHIYYKDPDVEIPQWLSSLVCHKGAPCSKKVTKQDSDIVFVKVSETKVNGTVSKIFHNKVMPFISSNQHQNTLTEEADQQIDDQPNKSQQTHWKDISTFIDKVSFVVCCVLNIACFTVFFIFTKYI